MIKSKKLQITLILTLTCICAPISGSEPNETKTEIKFEINKEITKPWVSSVRSRAVGPIKPTHVAYLNVRRPNENLPVGYKGIQQILNTHTGKTLSENQLQFLSASDAVNEIGIQDIQNHDQARLYAVSEEEAIKMARAYLEIAINRADAEVQILEKVRKEAKEKIIEIKKELPEKQKQLKAAESKYMEIKNSRYFLFDDEQAYEKARETMLQMDKMLDSLEIELAGIQEKMKVIESYRRTKRLPRKELSDVTIDKLDQMFVEQMVELRGVEARKKAALGIREREKVFLDFYKQRHNLENKVNALKHSLEISESRLHSVEDTLKHPRPNMLPPKLYQDKVTIYRVLEQ